MGQYYPVSQRLNLRVIAVLANILIMLVSIVVPKKLPRQKRFQENKGEEKHEEEENNEEKIKKRKKQEEKELFCNFLCVCVHSVEDSTLILIFDLFCFTYFSMGCQNSALIAIHKTSAGSISFNSWLRRHCIVSKLESTGYRSALFA